MATASRSVFVVYGILALAIAAQAQAAWTWQTVDCPGAEWTILSGVWDGRIVGTAYDDSVGNRPFLYDGANWTTLPQYPGGAFTAPHGISGTTIVGEYLDGGTNNQTGFLYDGAAWASLSYPGSVVTRARDISGNSVVGSYRAQGAQGEQGFLYTDGAYKSLLYPGASQTWPYGIYGTTVVGTYDQMHGFIYDGSTWETLDAPDAPYGHTWLTGIYGNLIIADSYLYDRTTGTWMQLWYPGSLSTGARGIYGNTIVGSYQDANFVAHGFILTLPEPSGSLLLGLGGVGALRRRRG